MSLSAAFMQALVALAPAGTQVFDYSAAADFAKLWRPDQEVDRFVIVWDGAIPGDVLHYRTLLAPHLTPLDWALAFSIQALRTTAERALPAIQILDLTGKVHEEWSLRNRHQLLAEMPWVTLHAPLVPDGAAFRQGYQPIFDEAAANGQSGSLLNRSEGEWQLRALPPRRPNYTRRSADLRRTADQWIASLAQSDDHHDINNVIGPSLLSGPSASIDILLGAFLRRLEWCGFNLNQATGWAPWQPPRRDELYRRQLNVLIVDDQLQHGWGRFACRLFGKTKFNNKVRPDAKRFNRLNDAWLDQYGGAAIWGCLGAEPLIRFLERNAQFDVRNYTSQIGQGETPVPEVILLDLRLYAGLAEAKQQATRLLNVARTRAAQGGLAWPAVSTLELSKIQVWAQGDSNDALVADEALLLLPRLLALALPLTPIILFSSTGKAWIRDRLKPYSCIFTGFEKPRVLSEPKSVEASISALHAGLNRAVKMIRLRLQLAHAQMASQIATNQRCKLPATIESEHVEIYVDETGELEQGITSGAAVCIYPDVATANALQQRMAVEHMVAGVVWAKAPAISDPLLSKGNDISLDESACMAQTKLLSSLLDDVGLDHNHRKLWSVVSNRVGKIIHNPISPVSLGAFPDAPLDGSLRANLEFICFVLLPYYSKSRFAGAVHIHLATRRLAFEREDYARDLCIAFDLGSVNRVEDEKTGEIKWLVPSTVKVNNVGTGFHLIRGWMQESASINPPTATWIQRVKTSMLAGNQRISKEVAAERRLFHDIADWICTASGKKQVQSTGRWIWPLREQLAQSGLFNTQRWYVSSDGVLDERRHPYYETDTPNFIATLAVLKASMRRSVYDDTSNADAIRLLLQNTYIQYCNPRLMESDHCSQQRLTLWALRHQLAHASGPTLHAVLASETEKPRRSIREPELEVGAAVGDAQGDFEPIIDDEMRPKQPVEVEGLSDPAEDASNETDLSGSSPAEQSAPELPMETVTRNMLSLEELQEGCSDGRPYEVVTLTKFGDVYLKLHDAGDAVGTHWFHDAGIANQLRNEGWSNPLMVYAKERASTGSRQETPLSVIALKVADGRWKLAEVDPAWHTLETISQGAAQ